MSEQSECAGKRITSGLPHNRPISARYAGRVENDLQWRAIGCLSHEDPQNARDECLFFSFEWAYSLACRVMTVILLLKTLAGYFRPSGRQERLAPAVRQCPSHAGFPGGVRAALGRRRSHRDFKVELKAQDT
jgi:hypothetical protein